MVSVGAQHCAVLIFEDYGVIGVGNVVGCGIGCITCAINYCVIDFIFATSMLAFCNKFGYPNVCEEYADKIRVGNTDLLYKVDHGYVGVVGGHKLVYAPYSANFFVPSLVIVSSTTFCELPYSSVIVPAFASS